MKVKAFLLSVFSLLSATCFSQEGNFYITNFPPSAYQASPQNWSVVQDSLKRIFVANNSGVMMYDGEYWTNTLLKDNKRAYSLAKSADSKTIYVGGENGEFGYLYSTASGTTKYFSLSDSLPKKEKNLGTVWSVQVIGNNVYYCSNERVCWYSNNKFQKSYTPTGEKFHTFFTVENTLLIREAGVGLVYLQNGSFHIIPSTAEFAGIKLRAVIPRKDHMYWLCTDKGLFLLSFDLSHPNWSLCSQESSPVSKWMVDNEIYCGLKLTSNIFALGSLDKGVILVDSTFHPVNSINYESGLQDETVNFIYKDFSGNIWLALNNGLSYIESNTPLTRWTKSNGLSGSIDAIAKYNNTLFIATDKGIEKLNMQNNQFENIGIGDEAWDLYPYKGTLLAGTRTGVYSITSAGKSEKIYNSDEDIYKIQADILDNGILYMASASKLLKGTLDKNAFIIKKSYSANAPASIVEDKTGKIFMGSIGGGYVYSLDTRTSDSLSVFKFNDTITKETSIFSYNDDLLVATESGIFVSKDHSGTSFTKDKLYNVFKGQMQIMKGIQFVSDLWIASTYVNTEDNTKTDEVSVLKHTANGFVQDYKLLKHIRGLKTNCFLIDSGKIFIGTNDGLIEYNTATVTNTNSFNTFIALITHKGDNDTICQNINTNSSFPEPEFSYIGNQICFYGAASDYYDKSELQFSYYLEGLNSEYCHWTRNNKMPYPNLPEGHYTFHLKSRDIFGIEGSTVTFSFTILAPWYRTIWAYLAYIAALVAGVIFIVKYNTKRLKEQNIKLENIITERTKTIAEQKALVEEKNKDILDSITYAKRLQDAILPPLAIIKKYLPESFVLYKPKDIVAGDFYWMERSGDNILIAACDCTGHGVPGAMVSVVCSNALNRALNEFKITETGRLLDKTRDLVLETFEKSESEVQDGMDISFCALNIKENRLEWSGANNPLWYIRNGEVIEITADKQPIGKQDGQKPFTTHKIELQKGDIIYLFTDGYADQFGGPKGKKFKYKQLMEVLLASSKEAMEEQKNTLNKVFADWKNTLEQVDDVLIIGIRI